MITLPTQIGGKNEGRKEENRRLANKQKQTTSICSPKTAKSSVHPPRTNKKTKKKPRRKIEDEEEECQLCVFTVVQRRRPNLRGENIE
jgi:hypothetical protein